MAPGVPEHEKYLFTSECSDPWRYGSKAHVPRGGDLLLLRMCNVARKSRYVDLADGP